MVCYVVVVNIIRLVPTIHLCRYMTKPTTIQSIPQVNNNNNISSNSATAAVAFLVQSAITIITYLWLLLLFAYIGGTHFIYLPACLATT